MSTGRDGASGGPDRSAETTSAGLSWLAFSRCRDRFRARWPSVFGLRRVDHHYRLAAAHVPRVSSLLDVGATDRVHEATARAVFPGVDYKSLDIDRTNRHDYHAFADVDRCFDLVTVIEVIEHLPPAAAVDLVRDCHRACAAGGHVLASVPNVYTPGIQSEWTHVAAFHYLDLVGLLAWVGFEVVDAARVYHGRWRHRLLHGALLHPLHRALGVDYAQSIVALARKV
jgi:SAM-dependent methyltransferase